MGEMSATPKDYNEVEDVITCNCCDDPIALTTNIEYTERYRKSKGFNKEMSKYTVKTGEHGNVITITRATFDNEVRIAISIEYKKRLFKKQITTTYTYAFNKKEVDPSILMLVSNASLTRCCPYELARQLKEYRTN